MKNSAPGSPPVHPPAATARLSAGSRPPAGPHAASRAGEESGGSEDRPLALVVDDAPDVAEMITVLLDRAGYEVRTALSARSALDAALAERFDVVVSDIGMPEMNGYELAAALRELPEYASVPMVAVTGFSMYDDRDRALTSGFDDFLTKPIDTRDLLDMLDRLRS